MWYVCDYNPMLDTFEPRSNNLLAHPVTRPGLRQQLVAAVATAGFLLTELSPLSSGLPRHQL